MTYNSLYYTEYAEYAEYPENMLSEQFFIYTKQPVYESI